MREQLALRGWATCVSWSRIGRACIYLERFLHFMVIGLVQGLYEQAFDGDKEVEWRLSEAGDLEMRITPLGIKVQGDHEGLNS